MVVKCTVLNNPPFLRIYCSTLNVYLIKEGRYLVISICTVF